MKLGKQVRRAIVHPEGHMDDAFAVTRSQFGESKTSMVILRMVTVLKVFMLNIYQNLKEIKKYQSDKPGVHFKSNKIHLEVDLEAVQLLISDSLEYFNPPPGETDEAQQMVERQQRNRQDIMQAEGLVILLKGLINKITAYTSTQNLQYLHKDQIKPLEELLGPWLLILCFYSLNT